MRACADCCSSTRARRVCASRQIRLVAFGRGLDSFWVDGGCSGIFNCTKVGRLSKCGYGQFGFKVCSCDVDQVKPALAAPVTGPEVMHNVAPGGCVLLKQQHSKHPCIPNETYGCGSGNVWTKDGCAGKFLCSGRLIICGAQGNLQDGIRMTNFSCPCAVRRCRGDAPSFPELPSDVVQCSVPNQSSISAQYQATIRMVDGQARLALEPYVQSDASPEALHIVPLHECVNLAPAATGTQTLADQLSLLRQAVGGPHAMAALHDHDKFIPAYQKIRLAAARQHFRNGSSYQLQPQFLRRRCFIITLRRPSDRIQSALRHDMMQYWCKKTSSYADCLQALLTPQNHPLSAFLDALRCATSKRSMWELLYNEDSPTNIFLHPQVKYIDKGISAPRNTVTELRFLCTNQLTTQWQDAMRSDPSGLARALLRNSTFVASMAKLQHQHLRVNSSQAGAIPIDLWARLEAIDRRVVHECMYPWDHEMYRTICEPGEAEPRSADEGAVAASAANAKRYRTFFSGSGSMAP